MPAQLPNFNGKIPIEYFLEYLYNGVILDIALKATTGKCTLGKQESLEDRFYKITNLRNGKVIAGRARIARDFKSRSKGLLNRKSLEKGEALLIKPCNSIHMFFMRFPIDVVFLDKKAKVVKVVKALKPWKLANCFMGYMALELPTKTIDEMDIKLSDFMKIE